MIRYKRYKGKFDRITYAALLTALSLLAFELAARYYTMVN